MEGWGGANPYAGAFANVFGIGGPAQPTRPNLGFGAMAPGGADAWGGAISAEEIERLRRLREAAMVPPGVNPGAMDAHLTAQASAPGQAPLPTPPAWMPPPAPQGSPPAPSAPAAVPVPPIQPYGPPVPSPDALRAAKMDGRTGWQQAGDWMARNFGTGGSGQPGAGGGMQALGAAGARMMAPPPQAPQMQVQHLQTPGNRPQARGGSLPIKPGAVDRARATRQQQQRRRGILDE